MIVNVQTLKDIAEIEFSDIVEDLIVDLMVQKTSLFQVTSLIIRN